MPHFAANLSIMFQEWPFLERFDAAAGAGFDAVEYLFPYDLPPDVIAGALSKNKLTQALFNLPAGDWKAGERGLAALPERAGEFRASVAEALEYAKATGVKRLHIMSGLAPQDESHQAAYRDAVRFAAEAAGAEGLNLLLEPINNRDIPRYFMNSYAKAAQLIAELGLPNLKLQFDIYHRQILHGDIIKGLEALLPITDHVQIASVPGRNEPGTGELDDYRVFEALDRMGYKNFVGCEYVPKAGTLNGLGWRDRVGK